MTHFCGGSWRSLRVVRANAHHRRTARVHEALNLKACDVRLESPHQARFVGKDNRQTNPEVSLSAATTGQTVESADTDRNK